MSLVVIGAVYSRYIRLVPLAVAAGVFAVVLVLRRTRIRSGISYALLGIAAWVAVLHSGIDPVVVGLIMGLLTYAYPAARGDLERASDLFRSFREQPTPELARSATAGLTSALSPNERLQLLYHPWTSYVIVPLFALANAGIVLSGNFLARAYASPITLGILIGYVAGKPAGIAGASWMLTRFSRGRVRPPVGWAAVTGVGTIAGIGFTVSILIATLAFGGTELQEAKLGVLSAALGCLPGDLASVPRHRLAAAAAADPCPAGNHPGPSTWGLLSTLAATTSAARTRRSSPSSSTATSNAPTAGRPNPCCGSSWPGTVTCGTSGGTSR